MPHYTRYLDLDNTEFGGSDRLLLERMRSAALAADTRQVLHYAAALFMRDVTRDTFYAVFGFPVYISKAIPAMTDLQVQEALASEIEADRGMCREDYILPLAAECFLRGITKKDFLKFVASLPEPALPPEYNVHTYAA